MIDTTIDYIEIMQGDGETTLLSVLIFDTIVLTGYVLCFVGSLSNFKKAELFKWGTLSIVIACTLYLIMQITTLFNTDYWNNISDEYINKAILSWVESTVKFSFNLLAYIGLFNLTLNKKSE